MNEERKESIKTPNSLINIVRKKYVNERILIVKIKLTNWNIILMIAYGNKKRCFFKNMQEEVDEVVENILIWRVLNGRVPNQNTVTNS